MSTCLRYLGAALVLGVLASAPARAQEWSYGPGAGYHDYYQERYWDGDPGYYGYYRDHEYWHHRYDSRYWESPEENVILSARYDHLLEISPGFRHYRMRKECGPIDFSLALREDCFASFEEYEPERW